MPDADTKDIFFGRQPILDRNQQLFAYELLFRRAGKVPVAASDLVDTFQALSVGEALGPYQGFVRTDRELLFSERVDTLPSHMVVLEIPDALETPETVARCEQLKQAGYVLAVQVSPGADTGALVERPLLKIAEIIKANADAEPEGLKRLASALIPLRKTLLAGKVESDARMRQCRDLGFDLFQGYYFTQPPTGEGKGKPPKSSEMALLRLLGLISQDADTSEIETVFKQEPILTVNLLRLTNSAGSGFTTKITSLRHAITLLGRRQLLRWLQLLLYSGASNSAPAVNPLLQLAATRGRLMELLVDHTPEAKQRGRELADQGFMVGILSLMPTILGADAADVLSKLPLAAPVTHALTERRGMLGELLALVEILEGEELDEAVARRVPGIDAARANACLTRALAWANNLAR